MAILQRPYAGQVKNLTPPAAGCGGWFLAVGGVICCGRWAAGLAGCGVGRCWRWAAGCCEVWQGVQAVQLVGCRVIGAALALLLVSVCFWLAVQVGGVICCGGGVPAGCVPVPVVGLICWRCRWAWSALAPFPLSAFQRHGWRWRCSIRAGFGRLPEGSDSPPNGSEKQV